MNVLRNRMTECLRGSAMAAAVLCCDVASAGWYDDGKVLLTGGVATLDGSGGGGITPWATISGYATRDGVNGGLHYTWANLPSLQVSSYGPTIGLFDRVELSYNYSHLSLQALAGQLAVLTNAQVAGQPVFPDTGLPAWNPTLPLENYGAKVRLFGDAVYTSDSWIPQVAVGGIYTRNKNPELLKTLSAAKDQDWEAYVAATKIFFPLSTLVNVAARYTAANQRGFTGFGGCNTDRSECQADKEVRFEASIAYLLAKNTAIGGEYQQHGGNLDGKGLVANGNDLSTNVPDLKQREESDWFDLFFAYAPNKNISFVLAYAILGNIAVSPEQNGFYLSTHATF